MCGILVHKGHGNRTYIQRRGDIASSVSINGFIFEHFLLPINGIVKQPYIDGDIVAIYNGEIYDTVFRDSDGECIIPLYKQYGKDFVKYLNGEFAIAIYDFEKKVAMFAVDLFATKPLWRNGLECGSYYSGVGGHKIQPSTIEIVSFDGSFTVETYHSFDFTQHKDTYDDWIKAFQQAVNKRAIDNCFIGLSSGYDSGAIVQGLLNSKTNFKAYVFTGNENVDILNQRMSLCDSEILTVQQETIKESYKNFEDYKYKVCSSFDISSDVASYGIAEICKTAKQEGRKVLLSGQGADEIIGDYAKHSGSSSFHGNWPEQLSPWTNFYGGLQEDYLAKEEYVGGSYAIETRYPFLDRDVVQEFLWLTKELKSKYYKAPIREFLIRYNVPFEEDVKRGYRPINPEQIWS